MPSIAYAYSIAQNVFHVDETKGVREAVVRNLTISVTPNGNALLYDIAFKKPSEGSASVAEATLYVDVDTALAAYKPLVLV